MLITLVILGIIAAITVPVLRSSLDDKKYRVPLKKVHAVLSEAFDLGFNFSDLSSGQDFSGWEFDSVFWKYIVPNLSIGKFCCADTSKLPGESGCFGPFVDTVENDCMAVPKSPNGKIKDHFNQNGGTPKLKFVLKDGTSVTLLTAIMGEGSMTSAQIKAKYGINPDFRKGYVATNGLIRYIVIYVDVNGKNGPNIAGKDVHAFIYTKSDGLIPAGADSISGDNSIGSSCNNAEYWACTYNYLHGEI